MDGQCINLLPAVGLLFGASIIGANLASWRMNKNQVEEFGKNETEKWKLLFNHALEVEPNEMLTERGILWRRISLGCFVATVFFAVLFGYLQSQSWVCKLGQGL